MVQISETEKYLGIKDITASGFSIKALDKEKCKEVKFEASIQGKN